jgi:glycosyltransferase involved in cell wall biosynthesis
MPVYNEEKTVCDTVLSCAEKIGARFGDSEIIVVDDASRDGTPTALDTLGDRMKELRILRNESNLGHGAALQRGLEAARADLVFVIDSDYQHEPGEFWRLYELYDVDTIVMGRRDVRVDAWYRRLLSNVGNRLIGFLTGERVRDINIPFKLFPGSILRELLTTLPQPALIPSTLLIVGAIRFGVAIRQVPIAQLPRRYGSSALPGVRFLAFGVRAAIELLRYRTEINKGICRSATPTDGRTR